MDALSITVVGEDNYRDVVLPPFRLTMDSDGSLLIEKPSRDGFWRKEWSAEDWTSVEVAK